MQVDQGGAAMSSALYQPFPMACAARAQIWRYAPQYRRPRHFHLEPEIDLVTAGRGYFADDESGVEAAAGDILWWTPGQGHELLRCSGDFELFVIGLTPELSQRVLAAHALSPLCGVTRLRLSPGDLTAFRARCAIAMLDGESAAIERHVGDVWLDAHRLRSSGVGIRGLTRRALLSMLEQPKLGRSDVARSARGHPSEVSRNFHKDMRLTITAYRTRLRLLGFIQAVDDGAGTLLEAALAAGFGSYSQCHRSFQRALGCSPRQFFGTSLRQQIEDAFSPARESYSVPPRGARSDNSATAGAVSAGLPRRLPRRLGQREGI
jgi:AraC-like DNA-binding protein